MSERRTAREKRAERCRVGSLAYNRGISTTYREPTGPRTASENAAGTALAAYRARPSLDRDTTLFEVIPSEPGLKREKKEVIKKKEIIDKVKMLCLVVVLRWWV